MNMILRITGNVKFPITLDAGVWIFDDRKIDLTTYFQNHETVTEEQEEMTVVSKHWDRVIKEGNTLPPTLKYERQYEKVKMLTGSFGIQLQPFLKNAEPNEDAKTLVLERSEGEEIHIAIDEAYDLIIAFAKEGKSLKEDGPVHVLYKDGSNLNDPIRYITGFRVE